MKGIYERFGILLDERENVQNANPWDIRLETMFHMTNDSGLFRTMEELVTDGLEPYWKCF